MKENKVRRFDQFVNENLVLDIAKSLGNRLQEMILLGIYKLRGAERRKFSDYFRGIQEERGEELSLGEITEKLKGLLKVGLTKKSAKDVESEKVLSTVAKQIKQDIGGFEADDEEVEETED